MKTRELLLQFQELTQQNKVEEAQIFLNQNQHDKRFVSLVELRKEFLDGFRKEILSRKANSNE